MKSDQFSSMWIPETRPLAKVRLLIAHHAGGSASAYLPLHKLLPRSVEVVLVELPGRGARFRQPFINDFSKALAVLARDLDRMPPKPTALFGHSMGALLMSELARDMTLRSQAPIHLFVSAVKSPGSCEKREKGPREDAWYLDRLRRYEGTPQAILDNPEMLQIILPIYRADYELIDSFRYDPARPLHCPMTIMGGMSDADVTASELSAWQKETSGESTIRTFEGGHFYLPNHLQTAAQLIQNKLL